MPTCRYVEVFNSVACIDHVGDMQLLNDTLVFCVLRAAD